MRLRTYLGLALAVTLTTPLGAQPPIAPPAPHEPFAPPAGSLYRSDMIGPALNITSGQIDRFDRRVGQLAVEYADGLRRLDELPTAQRAGRARLLEEQFRAGVNLAARDVFTPGQFARFEQLGRQYGAFAALAEEKFKERLGLSDAQLRSLASSVDWQRDQVQAIDRLLIGKDRERALRNYRDYRTQYQERLGQLLTPEQMRTYRELTGEPFDFPLPESRTLRATPPPTPPTPPVPPPPPRP